MVTWWTPMDRNFFLLWTNLSIWLASCWLDRVRGALDAICRDNHCSAKTPQWEKWQMDSAIYKAVSETLGYDALSEIVNRTLQVYSELSLQNAEMECRNKWHNLECAINRMRRCSNGELSRACSVVNSGLVVHIWDQLGLAVRHRL